MEEWNNYFFWLKKFLEVLLKTQRENNEITIHILFIFTER